MFNNYCFHVSTPTLHKSDHNIFETAKFCSIYVGICIIIKFKKKWLLHHVSTKFKLDKNNVVTAFNHISTPTLQKSDHNKLVRLESVKIKISWTSSTVNGLIVQSEFDKLIGLILEFDKHFGLILPERKLVAL